MASRHDMIFQVADLPVDGVEVHGEVEFGLLDIQDDGIFSFPETVNFDLHLAPVDDGVLVRGRLEGQVVRVCDRCLEPCVVALDVADVCHLFEHVGRTVIDLTDVLREDILLALPQALLCREDCSGLCPHCGRNRNETDCDCGQSGMGADESDPWGSLDELGLRDDG